MKNCYTKKIVAVAFLIFVYMFFAKSCPNEIGKELQVSFEKAEHETDLGMIGEKLESDILNYLWRKDWFIELQGLTTRILNMQGYFSNIGIYITDENYIVHEYKETSTDYEYEQMTELHSYCNMNNINLLYVNAPIKYLDDILLQEEFGVESFGNKNADVFLERIEHAGIATVDLRKELLKDGLNIYDMFYRTDHHWTVSSGLWAAEQISEGLNKYCEYEIDVNLFNKKNYKVTEWKECWLGEQGRKVAKSRVGLDDYELVQPIFDTKYLYKQNGELIEESFEYFIDKDILDLKTDVYRNKSWHYAYKRLDCNNSNVDSGKILVLGDSYSMVMLPFLSLGVSKIDSLVLRETSSDFSLRDYIKTGEYDTVIVCYAQFMIGAHDNPMSANYKMFDFK